MNESDTSSKAFLEGYKAFAFAEANTIADNPYLFGQLYLDWIAGYKQAELDYLFFS